jgi:hypothetical protein
VDGSTISGHPRQGHPVKQHPRSEHCRERWKGANQYINLFKDRTIPGWNPKEKLKKWERKEIQMLLEIMASVPEWSIFSSYHFFRAEKSIHERNHATEGKTSGAIVLYDSFFHSSDQSAIIVHESSHGLYDRLSPDQMNEFAKLSGWALEVDKMKVYEIPPKVLIQPDSALNREEDFANHVEEFFRNPSEYEKKFPNLFQFFKKRLNP